MSLEFETELPALSALLQAFASGALSWPATGQVAFLRAQIGPTLKNWLIDPAHGNLLVQQTDKACHTALQQAGLAVTEQLEGRYPLILLLPPRNRDEARALLAQAVTHLLPEGLLVCAQANNEGGRSGEADLQRLLGRVDSLSKHKCRVYWARLAASEAGLDTGLHADWLALDQPRQLAEGAYWTRPGLFAWDRVDKASALLARHLPEQLTGCGADLGAGFGYLASVLVRRCPAVSRLDLYEVERRALDMARRNLDFCADHLPLNFYWHDVSQGLCPGSRYDFIVSNPPFHQGRADRPQLGQAFLRAAAAALEPGGELWLVANRHLPYEASLKRDFRQQREVISEQGFKVIVAKR